MVTDDENGDDNSTSTRRVNDDIQRLINQKLSQRSFTTNAIIQARSSSSSENQVGLALSSVGSQDNLPLASLCSDQRRSHDMHQRLTSSEEDEVDIEELRSMSSVSSDNNNRSMIGDFTNRLIPGDFKKYNCRRILSILVLSTVLMVAIFAGIQISNVKKDNDSGFGSCGPKCNEASKVCGKNMINSEKYYYACCETSFMLWNVSYCSNKKALGERCHTQSTQECQNGLRCTSVVTNNETVEEELEYHVCSEYSSSSSEITASTILDSSINSAETLNEQQSDQVVEDNQDTVIMPQVPFGQPCDVKENNCIDGMKCARDVNDYYICCVETFLGSLLSDDDDQQIPTMTLLEEFCVETKSEGDICPTGNDLECERGFICSENKNDESESGYHKICTPKESSPQETEIAPESNNENDDDNDSVYITDIEGSLFEQLMNDNGVFENSDSTTPGGSDSTENEDTSTTYCDPMQNASNPVCPSDQICAAISSQSPDSYGFQCCKDTFEMNGKKYCSKGTTESCQLTMTDEECQQGLFCVQFTDSESYLCMTYSAEGLPPYSGEEEENLLDQIGVLENLLTKLSILQKLSDLIDSLESIPILGPLLFSSDDEEGVVPDPTNGLVSIVDSVISTVGGSSSSSDNIVEP